MEKLVRVISQGAPQSRQWTNPNTGEMKTITSVEVEMTDGLDRFIAEATDDLAIRYATLLMDFADEDQHTFDESSSNESSTATGCTSRYGRRTTAGMSASYRSADRPRFPSPSKGGESGGCHYKGGENRR